MLINYIEIKIYHCLDQVFKLELICYNINPTNILVNYKNEVDTSDLVITDFYEICRQKISKKDRDL